MLQRSNIDLSNSKIDFLVGSLHKFYGPYDLSFLCQFTLCPNATKSACASLFVNKANLQTKLSFDRLSCTWFTNQVFKTKNLLSISLSFANYISQIDYLFQVMQQFHEDDIVASFLYFFSKNDYSKLKKSKMPKIYLLFLFFDALLYPQKQELNEC